MKKTPKIDTNFTVVKSTLNQFCNNNLIKQKLNQHVLNSIEKPEAFKGTNKSLSSLAQKALISMKVKTL